ncbi:Uncharacterised protein [Vibrio cholerae]|nr:Uncharacterised protein [Vibrio cholerae]
MFDEVEERILLPRFMAKTLIPFFGFHDGLNFRLKHHFLPNLELLLPPLGLHFQQSCRLIRGLLKELERVFQIHFLHRFIEWGIHGGFALFDLFPPTLIHLL